MSILQRTRLFGQRRIINILWRLRRYTFRLNLWALRRSDPGVRWQTIPKLWDVGAASGFNHEWQTAARHRLVQLVGFEPIAQEFEKLKNRQDGCEYLPYALTDHDGPQALHITAHPECTSCLLPDAEAVRRFAVGKYFEVVRTETVESRSPASILDKGEMACPQFLKLDVQGLEGQILAAFGDHLQKVIGIELEAHFLPLYHGEKTFNEIVTFLDARGFELRRLETQGPFEGAAIEFNAYFSRRLDALSETECEMLELWEIVNFISPRHLETIQGLHT